jgi:hypothetical protein
MWCVVKSDEVTFVEFDVERCTLAPEVWEKGVSSAFV